MFLNLLGLLVTPSEMITIAGQRLIIAMFLIYWLPAPSAVLLDLSGGLLYFPGENACYPPGRPAKGRCPHSWRFSPCWPGWNRAQLLFNVAFVVGAGLTVYLQGSSLPLAATALCKVEIPPPAERCRRNQPGYCGPMAITGK